jgi:hypothetical protein
VRAIIVPFLGQAAQAAWGWFTAKRLIRLGQEMVNVPAGFAKRRQFLRCGENGLAEYAENMLRNERKLLIDES